MAFYRPSRVDFVDLLLAVAGLFALFGLLVTYWLIVDWWSRG